MEFTKLTFTLMLLACAMAYPQGPPVGEADGAGLCDSMLPVHGALPQTTSAPFQIKTSTQCYNEGATIAVRLTLDEMATEDNYFEGFFIMARKTDGTMMSYGTFDVMNQEYMSTFDCHDNMMTSVGHTAAHHFLARTFHWTAPNMDEGDLQFVGTVVHETTEFWLNVTSDVLSFDSNCTITTELAAESFPDIEEETDPCDVSASHRPEGTTCDAASALQPITALLSVYFALRMFFFA